MALGADMSFARRRTTWQPGSSQHAGIHILAGLDAQAGGDWRTAIAAALLVRYRREKLGPGPHESIPGPYG